MIKSVLLAGMSKFSYFKWEVKDASPGGCSVGYGYIPKVGWIRRECHIKDSSNYTLHDGQTISIPVGIAAAYERRRKT